MGNPSPASEPIRFKDDDWIPISEAALILGVHIETVRRLVKSNELASINPGLRKTKVRRSECLARVTPRGEA